MYTICMEYSVITTICTIMIWKYMHSATTEKRDDGQQLASSFRSLFLLFSDTASCQSTAHHLKKVRKNEKASQRVSRYGKANLALV